MIGFAHIMKAFKVLDYRACATSAMREAQNGEEIAQEILAKSGIRIDIISGEEEADVGACFKSSILKFITECSRFKSLEDFGDTLGLFFVNQFEPEYLKGNTGKVGAHQCDVFTRLNLHSLRLRT